MDTASDREQLKNWLLLVALAITWGCSFILMKIGLTAFSFAQVAGLRTGITSILFLPFFFRLRHTIDSSKWKYTTIVALFGNGIPAFLFAFAQTHINSALSGILNSLTPLWVMIVGALAYNIKVSRTKAVGIMLGLLGAILIVALRPLHSTDNQNNIYGLFIILATLMYGISSNNIKTNLQNVPPVIASTMAFMVIGPPCLIYVFGFTNLFEVYQTNPNAMAALVAIFTLSVMNTFIGNIAYYVLIQRTNAIFASIVTYLIPIVSIAIGTFYGESILLTQIGGMALILSGVYLLNKKELKIIN